MNVKRFQLCHTSDTCSMTCLMTCRKPSEMILACSSKLRIMTLRLFGDNCMPMLLLILEMFAQVPEEQLGVYRFVESESRGFQEEDSRISSRTSWL